MKQPAGVCDEAWERWETVNAVEAELAEMMGLLNAVEADLVKLVARILEGDLWHGVGIKSPEHYLTLHAGLSHARAHRLVMMARRVEELPVTTATFTDGRLTSDQAFELYKGVPAGLDREAADIAVAHTVTQIRRAVSLMPEHLRPAPRRTAEPEPKSESEDAFQPPAPPPSAAPGPPPELREVRFGFDDDGGWTLYAHLPADEGALVQKALEVAREAIARELGNPGGVTWSDALLRLVEDALRGADVATGRGGPRHQFIVHLQIPPTAVPPAPAAPAAPAAQSPPAAQPPPAAQSAPVESGPRSGTPPNVEAQMHLGPRIPPWLIAYLACDATFRVLWSTAGRVPVELTSLRRTVDDRMRILVEQRDQGCRVPGCAARRWLHIHHILHDTAGGETKPSNLCALCRWHHRAHHRGEFTITGDATDPNGLTFTTADGQVITVTQPRPPARPLPKPEQVYRNPLGEPVHWQLFAWSDPQFLAANLETAQRLSRTRDN